MKVFLSRLTLSFILFFLICGSSAKAQSDVASQEQSKALDQAKDFLESFKNDSALIILNRLVDELTESKKLNSKFGVKVRFRQAEALEKDHKDEVAIEKLLELVKVSNENQQWDILSHSHLSLARLFEKIGRPQNCLSNLRVAQSLIQKHEIDSIYHRFAIRISSYHRIFTNDRDSAIYYAKEVIRTAPEYSMPDKGVGHLLLGMLLGNSNFEESVSHFKEAGKVWKEVEDFTGYGYSQNNLSRIYFDNGKLKEALRYNDSTLVAAALSIGVGHDSYSLYYTGYKHRANIFKQMGQLDSAWVNINKGYALELREINKKNIEKVIEIDANYKDREKAGIIEEQKKLIKYEKDRRTTLLTLIAMIISFLGILIFAYLKLRNANQKTNALAHTIGQKNKALSKSLERQMVLQSEVHHRVKNNLQVIISLLDLQKEDIEDPKLQISIDAMSGRIYSMAAIHEILYQQEDMAQVNFFDYVENLCLHFSNFSLDGMKPDFSILIENQFFNLETSMPLGIIITELLTNSLKYARVEGQKLKIIIGLEDKGDDLCLFYKDNGPGFSNGKLEERVGGLGHYLMKSMSRQLNGRLESENDNGASYKIFFKEKNNPGLAENEVDN